jgi:hypothetical protein
VTDAAEFGRVVLIVAVGFAVAILSSRISGRLRVPAPALFLAAATVSSSWLAVQRWRLPPGTASWKVLWHSNCKTSIPRLRQTTWPASSSTRHPQGGAS